MTLFNIRHFSSTACTAAMAKRAQQDSGGERVTAKSRPMMNSLMPRRGWQSMDVPAGWVQVFRGPRPPNQTWPSAKSGSHQMQQRHQGVSRPIPRVVKAPPSRVNPEIARETALSKVLLLMSDCPQVATDVLKQELEGLRQETTNRCRTRTVPQVHLKVRGKGGRVMRNV